MAFMGRNVSNADAGISAHFGTGDPPTTANRTSMPLPTRLETADIY